MVILFIFDLFGNGKCGLQTDRKPLFLNRRDIHWLTLSGPHLVGLTLVDERTIPLFDLAAAVGLPPIPTEQADYMAVEVDADEPVAFLAPSTMYLEAISAKEVYELPWFLSSEAAHTFTVHRNEPVPIVDSRELLRLIRGQRRPSTTHWPDLAAITSNPAGSVEYLQIETGGLDGVIPSAGVQVFGDDSASMHPYFNGPDFLKGVWMTGKRLTPVIRMASLLGLPVVGEKPIHIGLDHNGHSFRFLVDAIKGTFSARASQFRSLPLLFVRPWMDSALVYDNRVYPVIDPLGGLAGPSRHAEAGVPANAYRPEGAFQKAFQQQDVRILEFDLKGMRCAVPDCETVASIDPLPIHAVPGRTPLVCGVAEYDKQLLPVLNFCQRRHDVPNPNESGRMIVIRNGDFFALVLTEQIYGAKDLALAQQHDLPFEATGDMVYGCYPDDGSVNLILNIHALAVGCDTDRHRVIFEAFARQPEKEASLGQPDKSPHAMTTDIEKRFIPSKWSSTQKQIQPEPTPSLTVGDSNGRQRNNSNEAAVDAASIEVVWEDECHQEVISADHTSHKTAWLSTAQGSLPSNLLEIEPAEAAVKPIRQKERVSIQAQEMKYLQKPELTGRKEKEGPRTTASGPLPAAVTPASKDGIRFARLRKFLVQPDLYQTALPAQVDPVSESKAAAPVDLSEKRQTRRTRAESSLQHPLKVGTAKEAQRTDRRKQPADGQTHAASGSAKRGNEQIWHLESQSNDEAEIKQGQSGVRSSSKAPLAVAAAVALVISIVAVWTFFQGNQSGHNPQIHQPSIRAKDSKAPSAKQVETPSHVASTFGGFLRGDHGGEMDNATASDQPEPIPYTPGALSEPKLFSTGQAYVPADEQSSPEPSTAATDSAILAVSNHYSAAGKAQGPAVLTSDEPTDNTGPSIVLQIENESGQVVIYRVRKGDTLWDISERYTGTGFNYPLVAQDNNIKNPHLIYPKQKINVK